MLNTLLNIKYLLLYLIVSLLLIACDDDPPVVPEPDPVMGCKVNGDIVVDYFSGKGFIGMIANERFQYYFSSYQVINGKEYGLLISLFPSNPNDTSGVFPIIHYSDSALAGNFAYAAFVVDNEKTTEVQYWADSGVINIDYVAIGKKNNLIKGRFNFTALDKATNTKRITVSEGWVNLEKQL
jgi:hypothetical protein